MYENFTAEHKILIFIAYAQKLPINTHVAGYSRVGGLKFELNLHLHPYTLCMQTAKALVSLHIDSPESLLLGESTKILLKC